MTELKLKGTIRFISDLHLCEQRPDLTQLFYTYLTRYAAKADSLYILGDLFEFWVGDDAMSDYHHQVAKQIKAIAYQGVKVFIMPGNRDFLLGERFMHYAGARYLADPSVIELAGRKILLKHGDDLCIDDIAHQRFRRFSQHPRAQAVFLKLPLFLRRYIANKVRKRSSLGQKPSNILDVNLAAVEQAMLDYKVDLLIHGHTHRPASYHNEQGQLSRIVLSDWRDTMTDLCYNCTQDFELTTSLAE